MEDTMSIEKQKKQKIDNLTSDVDWQYLHLYKFIVKYFRISKDERTKMVSSEKIVQRVLYDYLYLVEKFYTQFREDLKKEYNKNNAMATDVPVLMQEALDKLVEEWERVYRFIASNPESDIKGTQEFLGKLTPVINAAIRDAGFDPDSVRVIPQFENAYSLGFFNYSDDFLSLNVPLTKIKSPWEWTIFWHEMAGLRVRLLKKTLLEYKNILEELFVEVKRELDEELIVKLNEIVKLKETEIDPDNYEEELKRLYDECTIIPFAVGLEMALKNDSNIGSSDGDPTDIINALWRANVDDLLIFLEKDDLSLTRTKKFFKDQSRPMFMFSFDDLLPEVIDELRAHHETLVINELRDTLKEEVLNIVEPARNIGDAQVLGTQTLIDALGKSLNLNEVFTARKNALDEAGWSGDWLEELFEDSFSVMNFNLEFLFTFDNVLSRYKRRDQRHPPRDVRLAVALSLKLLNHEPKLQASNFLPDNIDDWPKWNKEAMGLNSENEYKSLIKFYDNLNADKEAVWLVAKKILGLYNWSEIPHKDTEEKKSITTAMAGYRTKKSQEWEGIANSAFDYLNELKLESANVTDLDLGIDKIEKGSYYIDSLLNRKRLNPEPLGYRELLELSFYDVDFVGAAAPVATHTIQVKGHTFSYSGILPPNTAGIVSYKVDKEETLRTTNPEVWNKTPGLGTNFKF